MVDKKTVGDRLGSIGDRQLAIRNATDRRSTPNKRSPHSSFRSTTPVKFHKRMIPLIHVEQISLETWQQSYPEATKKNWEIYREKGDNSGFANMSPEIGQINWVYFRGHIG